MSKVLKSVATYVSTLARNVKVEKFRTWGQLTSAGWIVFVRLNIKIDSDIHLVTLRFDKDGVKVVSSNYDPRERKDVQLGEKIIVEWDTNGPYSDALGDPIIVDIYAADLETGEVELTTEFCEDDADVMSFIEFTLSNPEFWNPTQKQRLHSSCHCKI